jgi:hypothetical protein
MGAQMKTSKQKNETNMLRLEVSFPLTRFRSEIEIEDKIIAEIGLNDDSGAGFGMRDLGWEEISEDRREEISKFLTGMNVPMLEFSFSLSNDTRIEGWFTDNAYDVPEDTFELTWGEYRDINRDSNELDAVEVALINGHEFRGGGGAAPPYLVRRKSTSTE